MKIKILTTDSNGKICLTQDELEALLKESYEDGYNEGRDSAKTIGGPVRREFVYSSEPNLFDNVPIAKAAKNAPKAKLSADSTPATSTFIKPTPTNDEIVKLLNGIFGEGSISNSPVSFSVNTKSNPSTIFDKLKKEVEGV